VSDSYLSDGDDATTTPGPTPSPPPQTAAIFDQRQFADPFRNLGDTTTAAAETASSKSHTMTDSQPNGRSVKDEKSQNNATLKCCMW